MIGDGSSDGQRRGDFPVLSDITNRSGKRRFVSISGSPVKGKVADPEFVRKVPFGVENFITDKDKRDSVEEGNAEGLPFARTLGLCSSFRYVTGHDSPNDDKISGISGVRVETNNLPTVPDGGSQISGENAVIRKNQVNVDGSKGFYASPNDDKISGISGVRVETNNLPTVPDGGSQISRENAVIRKNPVNIDGSKGFYASGVKGVEQCHKSGSSPSLMEGVESQGGNEHAKADVQRDSSGSTQENELMDDGELTSIKSNIAGSSSSKWSEPEICPGYSNPGGSNANHGVDTLNGCSCSFCRKAAYIWSDIQYQDVKGRIAALKKSREEVKSCVCRSMSQSVTGKNGVTHSKKSEELELNLMGMWKSLFIHTEDILNRENTQLQSTLLSFEELRRSCKMELEMANGKPLNK